MDFLRDPTFQFVVNVVVALLVAVAAVITSIAIFRSQRNRKEVSYEVLSDTPILSINEEIKEKVEIRFAGKLISDLRLAILRIWNSGNVPITPTDFLEPFSFEFKGGEILGSEILGIEPSNNKAFLKQNVDNVVLEPLLLNSGDSIKLKILVAGTNNRVSINTRIIGVSKITELDVRRAIVSGRSISMALAVLVVISIILTSLVYLQRPNPANTVSYNAGDATTVARLAAQYYNSVLQGHDLQAYDLLSINQQQRRSLTDFKTNYNYTLSPGCWHVIGTSSPELQADGKTWTISLLLEDTPYGSTEVLTYSWQLTLQKEQDRFVIVGIELYPLAEDQPGTVCTK